MPPGKDAVPAAFFMVGYVGKKLLIITSDHFRAKMYFVILLQVIQKTAPRMKCGGAWSFIIA